MAVLSTLNWKDAAGAVAPDSNQRGHLVVDMNTTQSWIADKMKVVLNTRNGFDLMGTIAYNLAYAAEFPATVNAETLTDAVVTGAEPIIGINIIRYTMHVICEAAGVLLDVRSSDYIPRARLADTVGGDSNLAVYLDVAAKIWHVLLADRRALSKVTEWNREASTAVIVVALHRYGDERHSWKTDSASRKGSLANTLLAAAGANKENFTLFMERYGHDIWHYLTDACIIRLAYILAGYPDYGRGLTKLPSTEKAICEMFNLVPYEGDDKPEAPTLSMRDVTTDIPLELGGQGEDEGDDADTAVAGNVATDAGPPVFGDAGSPTATPKRGKAGGTPARTVKAGILSKPEPKSTSGGGDDDDEDDDTRVKITDLIAVGQAAADRFPPGTFGVSALITGSSMIVAMLRHIGSKVFIQNLDDIIGGVTKLLHVLKSQTLERDTLLALKNGLQSIIIEAYGYCVEVPELADTAQSFLSLVNFAKRDPTETITGSVLAKRIRELESDPRAVERMIADVFNQLKVALDALADLDETPDGIEAIPAVAEFRVFRSVAQLRNEEALARARADVAAAVGRAEGAEGAV